MLYFLIYFDLVPDLNSQRLLLYVIIGDIPQFFLLCLNENNIAGLGLEVNRPKKYIFTSGRIYFYGLRLGVNMSMKYTFTANSIAMFDKLPS